MKAVVFHGIGDIRLEEVSEPQIQEPTDAIVRITTSAICGTDLHFIRGTFTGVVPGTVLGHEGVGVIEALGPMVRSLEVGDRVVIPSTIACGVCSYCRNGDYAQCDQANPGGKRAGTAFFGGPQAAGTFHGLQAEKARIPFAHVGLVKLPDDVSDEQAILLSDIAPTGYFGADLAEVRDGRTVARSSPCNRRSKPIARSTSAGPAGSKSSCRPPALARRSRALPPPSDASSRPKLNPTLRSRNPREDRRRNQTVAPGVRTERTRSLGGDEPAQIVGNCSGAVLLAREQPRLAAFLKDEYRAAMSHRV